MPSRPAILTRKPKPDPTLFYRVIQGGAFDRECGYWSPRIGDTVRGDDYRVEWLFAHDAADKFLVADGPAAGRSSSVDDARRQAETMERQWAAESREIANPAVRTAGPPLTVATAVVCTAALFYGPAGRALAYRPGIVYPASMAAVKAHPANFRPATEADMPDAA